MSQQELPLFAAPFAAPFAEPIERVEIPEPVVTRAPLPFEVAVTRSKKRRRTVGARLDGDVLRIAIPAWMTRADEDKWVGEMTRRFERARSTERFDLPGRASTLARRHGLKKPTQIRWSDDMTACWGSCAPSTGSISLSTRLAAFPDWVVDYVIVHELAHLEESGHDERFWALVGRYPKAERAIGYLIAKSGDGVD